MVLFEGVEFELFNDSNINSVAYGKFRSDIERVSYNLQSEFLEVMNEYFELPSVRKSIGIRASFDLPGFDGKIIYLPFGPSRFKSVRGLIEVGFACAHETGHYLHWCANPVFSRRALGVKGGDVYLLAESVAELSALCFYGLTKRTPPRYENSLLGAVYDFYMERGLDSSLDALTGLVGCDEIEPTWDLHIIKEKKRELGKKLKQKVIT